MIDHKIETGSHTFRFVYESMQQQQQIIILRAVLLLRLYVFAGLVRFGPYFSGNDEAKILMMMVMVMKTFLSLSLILCKSSSSTPASALHFARAAAAAYLKAKKEGVVVRRRVS